MQVAPRSEGNEVGSEGNEVAAVDGNLHLVRSTGLAPDGAAVGDDAAIADIEAGEPAASQGRGYAAAKRALDLAGLVVAVPLWLPLYLLIAGAILLTSGLPIHYTELRVGRHGRRFTCIKFRSMRRDHGEHRDHYGYHRVKKSRNDPRLTAIGRLLRRASVDEIPQLLNVLLGHMSLVGPRPITPREIARYYGPHASEVLSVRPGLTGLWQISGRSLLPMKVRVALDLRYVRERSIGTDLSIMARTIPSVLRGHGAY